MKNDKIYDKIKSQTFRIQYVVIKQNKERITPIGVKLV